MPTASRRTATVWAPDTVGLCTAQDSWSLRNALRRRQRQGEETRFGFRLVFLEKSSSRKPLLSHHDGHRLTVHRWVRDYSTRLHRFLSLFKPKLRGSIHADEVMVKVKSCHDYSWGAIDRRTKFKVSGPLTWTRSYRLGAAPLYETLRDRCEGLPPRSLRQARALQASLQQILLPHRRQTGSRRTDSMPKASSQA